MRKNKYTAFTLAEMMVVMLIMSIILAAMAPVMTTRNKIDNSSPWRYSPQNASNAYFGAGQAMHALIGQVEATENDNGKLVINTLGSTMSHILFKSNNDILGDLYFSGSSIVLGNRRNASLTIGNENINIGHENWSNASALEGSSNITIGDNSMQALTTGSNNIGIGTTLKAVQSGNNNVAVGDNSLTATTGSGNIAIGGNANQTSNTHSTIAIGRNSSALGLGAIAIGSNRLATENDGAAINGALAGSRESIAIGGGSSAGQTASIAIGENANASETSAVAIGKGTVASGQNSIVIGSGSAEGDASIAINGTASARVPALEVDRPDLLGRNAIAINGTASAGNSIAIGGATSRSQNSVAIGSGATAVGLSAVAINSKVTSEFNSIAINGTVNSSNAIALIARATGENAIGIGIDGTADGWNSIAIGKNATASTLNVIAIGNNATARGVNNIAIGKNACKNVTGSNKICIGADSGPARGTTWASDDYERVFIGGRSKFNNADAVLEVHNSGKHVYAHDGGQYSANDSTVVVNGNLFVKGHITSFIVDRYGNNVSDFRTLERSKSDENNASLKYMYSGEEVNPNSLLRYGTGYRKTSSDRRLKYVGKENTSGLDKIRQLKIFNFTYKKDPTKEPHVGVIAQDLQKVFPNAVKKGADGFLTIRMEDMFYAVINAIKELDSRVTALEKENKELKTRLDKLEAKIK